MYHLRHSSLQLPKTTACRAAYDVGALEKG